MSFLFDIFYYYFHSRSRHTRHMAEGLNQRINHGPAWRLIRVLWRLGGV